MHIPDKSWKVVVDDNFDHGDSSLTPVVAYDTLEEAITDCRSRVDAWLMNERKPGMAAEELFKRYVSYGDDPWILSRGPDASVPFSAWEYARRRCVELCGRGAAK